MIFIYQTIADRIESFHDVKHVFLADWTTNLCSNQNVRFHHLLWFIGEQQVSRIDILWSNLNTGFQCCFCYRAL